MAKKQKGGCRWKRFGWGSLAAILLLLVVRGTVTGEVFPADAPIKGTDIPLESPQSSAVSKVLPKPQALPKQALPKARSNWQLHELPIVPGCEGCCSQDVQNVPCLDVEKCAEEGPVNGKYALVLSHWGRPSEGMLGSIKSMRAAADKLGPRTDLLMVMLKSDANQTTPKIANLFGKWGIKLYTVDWDVPPNMKHYPKGDWCGHQDLIRLNVLGIEGYDAVAYFDGDCEFQGDITPMMRCAASGKFLSTSGGMGEALNVGFFAVKPDRRLVDAAVYFAQQNAYDHNTGWGMAGWSPNGGYYVGGECGQGFFYTLFYRKSPGSREALESVGLWDTFEAAQLDRCIWNYQTDSSCRPDLDCRHVRVHHKPTRERGSERECDKLQFRNRRENLLHRQTVSRPPPTEEELRWAKEGRLLKHSAGLCLRSSEEDGDGTLMLLSCSFPPVEQNIRVVEVDNKVYLKQGGRCSHVEGDDDPDMTPKEPRLAFPVDCASKTYQPHFKKISSNAVKGGFLLQHESGRCIHPYEGAENPRPITDVILHPDCNQDRKALTWLEDTL